MISIMILASAGILIGGFLLLRNVFDRIDEKWHDRWQYYKVIGVKSLRKAVTVALCIVSITFALIAGMCIPLDINVVSWWICGFHRRNDGFLKNGFGLKALYLATFEATKKWTTRIRNWGQVYGELSIMYEGRLPRL